MWVVRIVHSSEHSIHSQDHIHGSPTNFIVIDCPYPDLGRVSTRLSKEVLRELGDVLGCVEFVNNMPIEVFVTLIGSIVGCLSDNIPNGDIYTQPLNIGEAGKIQEANQTKALAETIYKMITGK